MFSKNTVDGGIEKIIVVKDDGSEIVVRNGVVLSSEDSSEGTNVMFGAVGIGKADLMMYANIITGKAVEIEQLEKITNSGLPEGVLKDVLDTLGVAISDDLDDDDGIEEILPEEFFKNLLKMDIEDIEEDDEDLDE